MIVEYIRYRVPLSRQEEFERAWSDAEAALRGASECLAYEVSHGVEQPENYVVRIEWSSIEDHERGFRQSAVFQPFSRPSSRSSSRSRRCATTGRRPS